MKLGLLVMHTCRRSAGVDTGIVMGRGQALASGGVCFGGRADVYPKSKKKHKNHVGAHTCHARILYSPKNLNSFSRGPREGVLTHSVPSLPVFSASMVSYVSLFLLFPIVRLL